MRIGVNIHTKKKNCNRCITYKDISHNGPIINICPLGYSIKILGVEEHSSRSYGIPQEKCPKPLTYSEFFDCLKNYKKEMIKKG